MDIDKQKPSKPEQLKNISELRLKKTLETTSSTEKQVHRPRKRAHAVGAGKSNSVEGILSVENNFFFFNFFFNFQALKQREWNSSKQQKDQTSIEK